MQGICAGIVTYNPEKKKLIDNINSIIDQVDSVYVIDNASDNVDLIESICDEYYITLLRNKENRGVAKGLNQLCSYAINKGYKWIITLDQDSISPFDLVEKLSKSLSPDVAIVAPNIIYKNNEKYADFISSGIKEETWVITSASLTNLYVWKKLNGFDEKLFIDGVDRDYCIRAYRSGFKILKDYDVRLWHELGNLKCRKIFGKTIYVTNHSSTRKYYMARNSIYLDRKLGVNTSHQYIAKLITKTIFFEDNKVDKIKMIYRGIHDGKRMMTSKLEIKS